MVLVAAQLVSLLWALSALVGLHGGEVPDPLPIVTLVVANVGLWVGYGLGPVVLTRLRGRGPNLDLGTRIRALDVPVGLVLGVVVQMVVLPILYIGVGWFSDADPGESAQELIGSIEGPVEAALFAFSAAVMAPLVEELAYRGLLLGALARRVGPVMGAVISSLVFALVHQELVLIPGLFVFGMVAAGLTLRFRRLGPAWAFHLGFNATTLVTVGLA